MNMSERDLELCKLKEEGYSLGQIAAKFNVSKSRVCQIYGGYLTLNQDDETGPPLKKLLSTRLQHALAAHFNDHDILTKPEKILSVPLSRLQLVPRIGKTSIQDLKDAMLALGYVDADDPWLNLV